MILPPFSLTLDKVITYLQDRRASRQAYSNKDKQVDGTTTLSIMTVSKTINKSRHSAQRLSALWLCRYAECHLSIMLSVVAPSRQIDNQ